MKRELLINIILGIVSLIVISIIIVRARPAQTTPIPSIQNNISTISMTDFAQHNTPADCWIEISGNIYNVTSYLNEHPGGADLIIPFCGGSDATQAFTTKGGRGSHSSRADQLLQNLFLGTLAPQ